MGLLINKYTFEGAGTSSGGGAYWKEGAKSNHYGTYCSLKFSSLLKMPILALGPAVLCNCSGAPRPKVRKEHHA